MRFSSVVWRDLEGRPVALVLGDYRIFAVACSREVPFEVVCPASLHNLKLFCDRSLIAEEDEAAISLIGRRFGPVFGLALLEFGAIGDPTSQDPMTFGL